MATPSGPKTPDLIDAQGPAVVDTPLLQALRERPFAFEFFQAVALLQRLLPGRAIGHFANPNDEVVCFGANNSLAFPASQIQSLEQSEEGQLRMKINFLGLTGPMGVLPYWYTELIIARRSDDDESLAAFLDIFNHRLTSLFYRGWEKYRFPVTYGKGEDDVFTHHLLDLLGLGTAGLQDRQQAPDDAFLHYVGLLGNHSRSAAALEQIIADYFGIAVEVEQFAGAWYLLDPAVQCRFEDTDDPSEQIGGGAVVGDAVWDQQSRVRLKLGPLTLERYREFLPGGAAYNQLRAITKFFSNDELDFELQLILAHQEVPDCGVGLDDAEPPQLGWVTWMHAKPLAHDPQDTILQL
jgi:type VI secretion system protein ImpH